MGVLKKKYILLLVFLYFAMASFSQKNYATCKVVEKNKVVSVTFGKEIKYLGSDYATQIGLYDENNRLRFQSAFKVVSYLCSQWGWKKCGNPIISDNFKVKTYLLEHEIRFNTNLFKQMEMFNKYEEKLTK